ncbi:RNA-guided endonuclease TnpB family protein [Nocardia seriolae]|uniref:RNA-guided endonuclease TnpB family protein n=1 Tax=Nocardia seriolae TaxID=37332 RepID=UPI000519FEA4|nr:RNA-guided endonuclease TnpB family protein [Nocardia seriolae]MTJ62622.1 IS200/IS605 family element transposase accessory protein TnpB [Nocardia seriolae]MTJ75430.1 IS200/IS605 family element transposase accessory protein TnpB [Nocardia seriolae]MTJ89338.1 IS200/IS605 family element transposase accessory protein TnpB [Nocardia seriolae]MTK33315.1 IS200/IS605 family element transposase accessory protein TnpB [Nocardia seriolae]MTK42441.1 IS200/IS605 family element transposase accessory prot
MGDRVVKRAYKYRFYPTPEQAEQLAKTFGCVRYVYNRALAERSRAWTREQRRVSYAESDKMLTGWKRDPETEWLTEPSKGPLQATLRNLQRAFDQFWRKQTGYPKFKKKGKSKDSATYFSNCFTYRDGRITLAKQSEPLDIRWSRPLPEGAVPSQVTVSRDSAGRHHIAILVEETIHEHAPTDVTVGVDAGITSLYTFSTGEKVSNPRYEKLDRTRLAKAQRVLAKKQRGSNNRAKARLKVARIHAQISDRRRDHLHKLSTRVVRENQVITIEDLSVRNMVRNHNLARAISDASWSQFRSMLEYKADWYGRTVVAVDRFYPSSKTCSTCGRIADRLPLDIREWTCPCGAVHDRDVNAAKNIQAAGLAVLACGDGVRPSRS